MVTSGGAMPLYMSGPGAVITSHQPAEGDIKPAEMEQQEELPLDLDWLQAGDLSTLGIDCADGRDFGAINFTEVPCSGGDQAMRGIFEDCGLGVRPSCCAPQQEAFAPVAHHHSSSAAQAALASQRIGFGKSMGSFMLPVDADPEEDLLVHQPAGAVAELSHSSLLTFFPAQAGGAGASPAGTGSQQQQAGTSAGSGDDDACGWAPQHDSMRSSFASDSASQRFPPSSDTEYQLLGRAWSVTASPSSAAAAPAMPPLQHPQHHGHHGQQLFLVGMLNQQSPGQSMGASPVGASPGAAEAGDSASGSLLVAPLTPPQASRARARAGGAIRRGSGAGKPRIGKHEAAAEVVAAPSAAKKQRIMAADVAIKPRAGRSARSGGSYSSTRTTKAPASLADSCSDDDSDDANKRRKQHNPWSLEETEALITGVERCGGGRWADIKKLGFAVIERRSAVDLKDKWRNLMRVALSPSSAPAPASASSSGGGAGGGGRGGGASKANNDKRREVPNALLDRVRAVVAANPSGRKAPRGERGARRRLQAASE